MTLFWAMALKPFIGIVFLVVLFGSARLLAHLAYFLIPECRLKRELFAQSVSELSADRSRQPPKRLFD
jgi:hypothetical protein